MNEGWHDDAYWFLFDEREMMAYSERYGIDRYLPGYRIVGLVGWDDFVVVGPDGELATVPTVPIDAKYMQPLSPSLDPEAVMPDEELRGKVKWYTKPIVFGGDPRDPENMIWVPLATHVELVRWWNDMYQKVK